MSISLKTIQSRPFQSQLNQHFQLIRTLRKRRKSWQEIADHLKQQGTQTSASAILQFYKRHSKRPAPIGMIEPQAGTKTNPSWLKATTTNDDLDLSFSDPLDAFVKLPPQE